MPRDKESRKASDAAYRERNREKIRQGQKAYYQQNKEKWRAYQAENSEETAAYQAEWREQNWEEKQTSDAARRTKRPSQPDKLNISSSTERHQRARSQVE